MVKLKKFKEKKLTNKNILVSSIILLGLMSSVVISKTYAIYKVEKRYDLIKAKIGDFRGKEIVENYFIDNNLVNSKPDNEFYYVKNVSCDNAIGNWNELDNKLILKNITKYKVTCNVNFTKINDLITKIKALNLGNDVDYIDYDKISSETNGKGVYSTTKTQTNKEIYFFRGNIDYNNVIFGNFCWKILRTTETDGIKMIYNGVPDSNGYCNNTGDNTEIGKYKFNSYYKDNAYVGYMYGEESSDNYEKTHENKYDSYIKKVVEYWYLTNLYYYDSYIEDTIYCNDRSLVAGGENNTLNSTTFSKKGYAANVTGYGALSRSARSTTITSPSLKCVRKEDSFTTSTSDGNGMSKYKVGLITADEVIFAGATAGGDIKKTAANNTNFYLYNGNHLWTMTPVFMYTNGSAYVIRYINSGSIHNNYAASKENGIRPVISLKSGTMFLRGKGTETNPFVINEIDKTSKNVSCNKNCIDNDSNGIISIGDLITIGTESFYVSYINNNKIEMMGKYNLLVGNSYSPSTGRVPITNATGIQDPKAIGYNAYVYPKPNVIDFSDTNYWTSTGSQYPSFVYDEKSIIYKYLEYYKKYLNENYNLNAIVTLVSKEQLDNLASYYTNGVTTSLGAAINNKVLPSWAYSTSYWTGTASGTDRIWHIRNDGGFYRALANGKNDGGNGIRPMVIVPISYFQN